MQTSFPPRKLIIASRESRLAMWQATHVQAALRALYPACGITINSMTTRGDQILDRALSKVGGKGLFVKELEAALAEGRADLAVHSLKDVPMELPHGFALAAIMERENPHDAFVSNDYASLDALPPGSVVGTSSLRREAALRARYPHLHVQPLRGNLDTRLAKLDRGDYAAIILAAAGLIRLGAQHRIRALITPEQSLPAAGQGALGIEICADRPELAAWLAPLHHLRTALVVQAERQVSRRLGGSCEVPLAAYAQWQDDIPQRRPQLRLQLRATVATPDASRLLRAQGSAHMVDIHQRSAMTAAVALGDDVAQALIAQGALDIVQALNVQGTRQEEGENRM
jgi:hydroxymethylbilane synthase